MVHQHDHTGGHRTPLHDLNKKERPPKCDESPNSHRHRTEQNHEIAEKGEEPRHDRSGRESARRRRRLPSFPGRCNHARSRDRALFRTWDAMRASGLTMRCTHHNGLGRGFRWRTAFGQRNPTRAAEFRSRALRRLTSRTEDHPLASLLLLKHQDDLADLHAIPIVKRPRRSRR